MDTISRRRFLIASSVTGAAALATGTAAVTWQQLHQRAVSEPSPIGSNILVIVTLYGGNDGLNTVIPYADSAYHDARPELAYTASEVLQLDNSLGLNPALKGLHELWQRNQLAIVRGVDYPNPDFSHFRSMDIWQTASPSQPVNTGWIGRWLDATGDDPIRAVNIGSVLPPLAVGDRCTAAALPSSNFAVLPANLATALTGLGQHDEHDKPATQMVSTGYAAERKVAATFGSLLGSAGPQAAPPNSLAAQLAVVGRCIKAGVPTSVYSVDLGGFDTHADEKATQQALLGVLDTAVSSFLNDMATNERGRAVTLMAYSEFGRRVAANASQGTDHGSAGPVFVAGVPVKGGFYGAQPSLRDLSDGNLKPSVDFRTVYAELLRRVLNCDSTQIIGNTGQDLGFLS